MQFYREGIVIGPLFLHYYGLIIMIGVLAGVMLAMQAGKKRGLQLMITGTWFPGC